MPASFARNEAIIYMQGDKTMDLSKVPNQSVQPQFTTVHVLNKAEGKPEVALSTGNITFGEVKPTDAQGKISAKDIAVAMNNPPDHQEIKSNPNLPGFLQMGQNVSTLV
jgi:hypothetical protein